MRFANIAAKDVGHAVPELPARIGGFDEDATLVMRVTSARHVPGGLQTLEQGSQGPRVEAQPVAERTHRLRAVSPQSQHHEVLRVGQADIGEELGVLLRHRPRGRIEREAQLDVKVEGTT